MELLSIAQELMRRRILVAVGLVVAVLLGAHVSGVFPPRGAVRQAKGQALVRVLIDTPLPLVASTTPDGADTILQRTILLAALMGSTDIATTIAQRAGVPPDQLAVVAPTFYPVSVYSFLPDGELPQRAALAAAETAFSHPFVVQLRTDAAVPIISVGAIAPDVHRATALANATIAALRSASAPNGGGHATLTVEPLGPVRSAAVTATSSSHRLLGIAAAVAGFLAWCAGIVIASGLADLFRRARRPAIDGAI